jgi:hypothetical protein
MKLGLAPLASPAHLAGFNPTGQVPGRSNRPSPDLLARSPLPLSSFSPVTVVAAAIACNSWHLRWFPPLPPGQLMHLDATYLRFQLDSADAPSARRSLATAIRVSAIPAMLELGQDSRLLVRCSCSYGGFGGRAAPVEVSPVGCSRCCHGAAAGKVSPGLRLVGRAGTAPPCLPGMRLGVGK